MMTVAYCRVSTDEQAAEGYSIDGQSAKLTAYADLHDLGAGHRGGRPRRLRQEHEATGAARSARHGSSRSRRARARVAPRPALSGPGRHDPARSTLRGP